MRVVVCRAVARYQTLPKSRKNDCGIGACSVVDVYHELAALNVAGSANNKPGAKPESVERLHVPSVQTTYVLREDWHARPKPVFVRATSPGGSVDVKHNSYARYLAEEGRHLRKKSPMLHPLRKQEKRV